MPPGSEEEPSVVAPPLSLQADLASDGAVGHGAHSDAGMLAQGWCVEPDAAESPPRPGASEAAGEAPAGRRSSACQTSDEPLPPPREKASPETANEKLVKNLLGIQGVALRDLEKGALSYIVVLNLSGCGLTELAPSVVSQLQAVEFLSIKDNSIQDLSPVLSVPGLPLLWCLDASFNAVSSLAFLTEHRRRAASPCLGSIDLRANDIKLDQMEHLVRLPCIEVKITFTDRTRTSSWAAKLERDPYSIFTYAAGQHDAPPGSSPRSKALAVRVGADETEGASGAAKGRRFVLEKAEADEPGEGPDGDGGGGAAKPSAASSAGHSTFLVFNHLLRTRDQPLGGNTSCLLRALNRRHTRAHAFFGRYRMLFQTRAAHAQAPAAGGGGGKTCFFPARTDPFLMKFLADFYADLFMQRETLTWTPAAGSALSDLLSDPEQDEYVSVPAAGADNADAAPAAAGGLAVVGSTACVGGVFPIRSAKKNLGTSGEERHGCVTHAAAKEQLPRCVRRFLKAYGGKKTQPAATLRARQPAAAASSRRLSCHLSDMPFFFGLWRASPFAARQLLSVLVADKAYSLPERLLKHVVERIVEQACGSEGDAPPAVVGECLSGLRGCARDVFFYHLVDCATASPAAAGSSLRHPGSGTHADRVTDPSNALARPSRFIAYNFYFALLVGMLGFLGEPPPQAAADAEAEAAAAEESGHLARLEASDPLARRYFALIPRELLREALKQRRVLVSRGAAKWGEEVSTFEEGVRARRTRDVAAQLFSRSHQASQVNRTVTDSLLNLRMHERRRQRETALADAGGNIGHRQALPFQQQPSGCGGAQQQRAVFRGLEAMAGRRCQTPVVGGIPAELVLNRELATQQQPQQRSDDGCSGDDEDALLSPAASEMRSAGDGAPARARCGNGRSAAAVAQSRANARSRLLDAPVSKESASRRYSAVLTPGGVVEANAGNNALTRGKVLSQPGGVPQQVRPASCEPAAGAATAGGEGEEGQADTSTRASTPQPGGRPKSVRAAVRSHYDDSTYWASQQSVFSYPGGGAGGGGSGAVGGALSILTQGAATKASAYHQNLLLRASQAQRQREDAAEEGAEAEADQTASRSSAPSTQPPPRATLGAAPPLRAPPQGRPSPVYVEEAPPHKPQVGDSVVVVGAGGASRGVYWVTGVDATAASLVEAEAAPPGPSRDSFGRLLWDEADEDTLDARGPVLRAAKEGGEEAVAAAPPPSQGAAAAAGLHEVSLRLLRRHERLGWLLEVPRRPTAGDRLVSAKDSCRVARVAVGENGVVTMATEEGPDVQRRLCQLRWRPTRDGSEWLTQSQSATAPALRAPPLLPPPPPPPPDSRAPQGPAALAEALAPQWHERDTQRHTFVVSGPDARWHPFTETSLSRMALRRRQREAAAEAQAADTRGLFAPSGPQDCSGSLAGARAAYSRSSARQFMPATIRTQLAENMRRPPQDRRPPSAPVPATRPDRVLTVVAAAGERRAASAGPREAPEDAAGAVPAAVKAFSSAGPRPSSAVLNPPRPLSACPAQVPMKGTPENAYANARNILQLAAHTLADGDKVLSVLGTEFPDDHGFGRALYEKKPVLFLKGFV